MPKKFLVYVTYYRYGYNVGKSDDELANGLLFLQQCGGNLIDVMGDLFCRDSLELTMDQESLYNRYLPDYHRILQFCR